MNFDINKLEKLMISRSKRDKFNLTEEEISFMSKIFSTIINSDNYDSITEYLAGIYNMSVSDIKFIRNVYYLYYADNEDKKIYNEKMKEIRKEKTRRGFVDLSAVISFTIFLSVFGITLAYVLYNLL